MCLPASYHLVLPDDIATTTISPAAIIRSAKKSWIWFWTGQNLSSLASGCLCDRAILLACTVLHAQAFPACGESGSVWPVALLLNVPAHPMAGSASWPTTATRCFQSVFSLGNIEDPLELFQWCLQPEWYRHRTLLNVVGTPDSILQAPGYRDFASTMPLGLNFVTYHCLPIWTCHLGL